MTVTNEPTTTPEVPAWLNLDGAMPAPELVHSIKVFTENIRPRLSELRDIQIAAVALSLSVDEACVDMPDVVYQYVRNTTGLTDLIAVLRAGEDLLSSAAEGAQPEPESLAALALEVQA